MYWGDLYSNMGILQAHNWNGGWGGCIKHYLSSLQTKMCIVWSKQSVIELIK